GSAHEHFRRVIFPRTVGAIHGSSWHSWFRRRLAWPLMTVPALAAAVMAIFILPSRNKQRAEPMLAVKGGPTLRVIARHGGKVFRVASGTKLVPGDEIRFVVEAGDMPYLLVASIDGMGKDSIYFPFGGNESARIHQAHVELPGSILLDHALGPERVF